MAPAGGRLWGTLRPTHEGPRVGRALVPLNMLWWEDRSIAWEPDQSHVSFALHIRSGFPPIQTYFCSVRKRRPVYLIWFFFTVYKDDDCCLCCKTVCCLPYRESIKQWRLYSLKEEQTNVHKAFVEKKEIFSWLSAASPVGVVGDALWKSKMNREVPDWLQFAVDLVIPG